MIVDQIIENIDIKLKDIRSPENYKQLKDISIKEPGFDFNF
jgi:hypothetical protein